MLPLVLVVVRLPLPSLLRGDCLRGLELGWPPDQLLDQPPGQPPGRPARRLFGLTRQAAVADYVQLPVVLLPPVVLLLPVVRDVFVVVSSNSCHSAELAVVSLRRRRTPASPTVLTPSLTTTPASDWMLRLRSLSWCLSESSKSGWRPPRTASWDVELSGVPKTNTEKSEIL